MKLIKINLTQTTILTKNQIGLFLKNYKFIALISSFTLLNLIINVFGLIIISSNDFVPDEKLMTANILVAITSILIIIQTIYLTVNCFITQLNNNIHTTELRYGYKVRSIYTSRIIFVLTFSLFYLLIMFIIASIFFGIGQTQNNQLNIYLYRLYISAFAWYVSLMFFSVVITVLLAKFLAEATTSIIASILGFFLILIPAISGFISNYYHYDANSSYFILVTEDYRKNLYHDLKDDETFQAIYPEFKDLYYQIVNDSSSNISTEKLLAGPKLWELEDETQIKNYQEFYQKIIQVLNTNNKEDQITSWDSIPETSEYHYYEPFNELFNKLLSDQTLKEYHHLFNVMKEYTINFTTLKELRIIYTPVVGFDLQNEFMAHFYHSTDEYFFIKTLNSLLLRLVEASYITNAYATDNITIEQIQDRINKDHIANMLNPLRHFNLMFQSVDYNNKFLFNFYGQTQYVYSSVPNITFALDDNNDIRDLDVPLKLKQSVSIVGIYLFYWFLGLVLLCLSFLGFNRRVKK